MQREEQFREFLIWQEVRLSDRPGTSVGAVGEGRWHVLFAKMGMVAGGVLYVELYPFFKSSVLAWKDFGRIEQPERLGVSPWVIIPLFWAGTVSLFFWFEKKGL